MKEVYPGILQLIDVMGTFAFTVSGAFAAMERRLDPFGVLIISFVTAVGGGTLRDVLVGDLPVRWLANGTTIGVVFAASVATMLFGSLLKRLDKALFLFDALGLGFFTIVGVEVGINKSLSASICIALGTITACFGGVLRDVLLNKVPLIFHKEIYALACIAGGGFYYALYHLQVPADLAKVGCIFLVFAIRFLAIRYQLALPRFYLKQDS
ncbi:Uncharacterized membrane protein YeiH [Cnuella takakiae]|uniref:Uncharacterized membrane protein YeiH n=1 Tax=Cnuella takakiae TaxID=1302690 RepID=A0A1M5BQM1_9BACT|nr:trimeric intracellular cation channel family protein [Cnuella takakiae]SHF44562.1 Uncharacterized membrane protein YeiH [Cnuella takakiae]